LNREDPILRLALLIENPILRSFELLDVQCFHLSQNDKSLKLGVPNCDTAPAVWDMGLSVQPSGEMANQAVER